VYDLSTATIYATRKEMGRRKKKIKNPNGKGFFFLEKNRRTKERGLCYQRLEIAEGGYSCDFGVGLSGGERKW
jgi:hypothetical protein